MTLKTRDKLNPNHEGIRYVAHAIRTDDILDVWLDRIVVADVDGVAGFQHLFGRRALAAKSSD